MSLRTLFRTSRKLARAREVAAHRDSGAPEALAQPALSQRLPVTREVVGQTTVTLAVAALVAVSGREEGAYYVDVWAPLGLLLLAAVGALMFFRRGPARLPSVGAAALLSVGGWAVLSTQWGGIPNDAWTMLGQSIVAAAALLAASGLAVDTRGQTAVYAGVFLGLTEHAVEILIRVAVTGGPAGWFFGRYLDGPVGYHNAQATLFVLGLPLALAATSATKVYVRAIGGGASGAFLGALILTQSRGGLLAAGVAVFVLLVWSRDRRLLLFSAPVLAATAALFLAVRDVDAALADGSAAAHLGELRGYVIWCSVVALIPAAAAAANVRSRLGGAGAVAVASVSLALVLAGGIHARGSIERAIDRATHTSNDRTSPDDTPAGSTRLVSLSLNGRRAAWRTAWKMIEERPLAGAGQGQFSRHWGTDRPKSYFYFYILQPHSLELELLSELGAVGLVAFAVFVGSGLVAAAKAGSRRRGAIAGAMLIALVGEASVDWSWSFPGVVLPVLLIVGAAAPGRRIRRPRLAAPLAAASLVAAAAVLAAPYLSDRQLDRGRALAATNPDEAWTLSLDAQRLDPWDQRVLAFQGKLAEAAGRYMLAARKYDKAATLSRQPWIGYFQEAGVLKTARSKAERRGACKRALRANPTEDVLRFIVCDRLD